MAQKTYNPLLVVITFKGNIISGFADGTFLMVERDTETFSKVIGASGEVCRVRSLDRSGKATITLLQSSVSNDILSAINTLDELTGEGVGAFLVSDLNGTTLLAAPNAWIEKPASAEFGKELSDREWVLALDQVEMGIGGIA